MEFLRDEMMKHYKNFEDYMEVYGQQYSDYALEYIYNTFGNDLYSGYIQDIMLQIYAEIDLIPEERNIYKGFIDLFKTKYSLDKNILEVGGGYFPAMAKYIDGKQQQERKGSITVYDPRLITNKLGNIRLVNECFTLSTNIDEFDRIIALASCGATEIIIKKANEANIDFFIGLCNCVHFPSEQLENYSENIEVWHNYLFNLARDTMSSEREFAIDYLKPTYGYECPIISSRVKK